MKNIIIIFLMLSIFQVFSTAASKTEVETVKIKCSKMHCEGCKATITEALQSMEGVTKIDIDLKKKIIKVTFDNSKTDKVKISEKILEAGYENEIIG
jgi:copper chaperone CopZ